MKSSNARTMIFLPRFFIVYFHVGKTNINTEFFTVHFHSVSRSSRIILTLECESLSRHYVLIIFMNLILYIIEWAPNTYLRIPFTLYMRHRRTVFGTGTVRCVSAVLLLSFFVFSLTHSVSLFLAFSPLSVLGFYRYRPVEKKTAKNRGGKKKR